MATKKAPAKPTTAVAVHKPTSGAIVDIKAQLAAQAAAIGEKIAPATGNSIQVGQDKMFTLPGGLKCESFEAVILDFCSVNNFYPDPYDRKNIKPPVCFAISPTPKGMVPSPNSPVRQSDTCGDCPNFQYESAATGKGKACKEGRLLILASPDANAESQLMRLNVSPTALKTFDSFVASVQSTFSLPPIGVRVTIGFNDAHDFPSVVFSSPQPNENLETHFARQAEAQKMLATEPDLTNFATAYPKLAAKAASKPVAKAAGRR